MSDLIRCYKQVRDDMVDSDPIGQACLVAVLRSTRRSPAKQGGELLRCSRLHRERTSTRPVIASAEITGVVARLKCSCCPGDLLISLPASASLSAHCLLWRI